MKRERISFVNDFLFVVACFFAILAGAAMPLAAFMYADFLKNSISHNRVEQEERAAMIGLMYFAVAGMIFFAILIEVSRD